MHTQPIGARAQATSLKAVANYCFLSGLLLIDSKQKKCSEKKLLSLLVIFSFSKQVFFCLFSFWAVEFLQKKKNHKVKAVSYITTCAEIKTTEYSDSMVPVFIRFLREALSPFGIGCKGKQFLKYFQIFLKEKYRLFVFPEKTLPLHRLHTEAPLAGGSGEDGDLVYRKKRYLALCA